MTRAAGKTLLKWVALFTLDTPAARGRSRSKKAAIARGQRSINELFPRGRASVSSDQSPVFPGVPDGKIQLDCGRGPGASPKRRPKFPTFFAKPRIKLLFGENISKLTRRSM